MKKILLIAVALATLLIFAGCKDSEETAQANTEIASEDVKKCSFKVGGMTCDGCAFGLKTALKKVKGVKSASASYGESSADVEFDQSQVKIEDLVAAVKEAGYSASVVEK